MSAHIKVGLLAGFVLGLSAACGQTCERLVWDPYVYLFLDPVDCTSPSGEPFDVEDIRFELVDGAYEVHLTMTVDSEPWDVELSESN